MDMKKLKMKKNNEEGGDMPEHEKHAKMSVLSHLRDMAQGAMGSKLNGMKKVSVLSDSSEGLQHGLEKAKELTQHHLDNEDAEMAPEMMDKSPHTESQDRYENLEHEEGDQDGAEESAKEEAMESPEEEASEHQPMPGDELHHSPEDVDAHIAHLHSLKKHMMKSNPKKLG